MHSPLNGDLIEGFRVIDSRPIPGMGWHGVLLEHERLGTRMFHVIAKDSENLAAIIVPTPPSDDTGLPHIMEHSVLGGSKRFPLKDPFFEMIKCSLATFINAMTYDNFTMYPFASVVTKDLFNLAEVYFDAVFHPRISQETFRREAYHLIPHDDGGLTANGIVYNEMKAAYSNADTHLWRETQRALFPDSPLRFDSGGYPPAIPNLTYDVFKRFYDTFYHPSKVHVFCYGDIPTGEYCRFFNEGFAPFVRGTDDRVYTKQPRWTAPRRAVAGYPVGPNEPLTGKTYHQLAWIAGECRDMAEYFSLMVCIHALTGTDAAPLRKAVIDAHLGADLNWNMAHAFVPEIIVTTGIKGSEAAHADAYQDLVLATLNKIAREGLPQASIATAIQQLSYRYLERTSRSLVDMAASLAAPWLYGADPFAVLDMRAVIDTVRVRMTPPVFSAMIRERFIDNPHRLLMTLQPDRSMRERTQTEHDGTMRARAAQMTPEERSRLADEARALEARNSAADTPEALATLPRLSVQDLPGTPSEIPTQTEPVNERVTLLVNDMPTNGISYFCIDADISALDRDLYPMLPVFREVFDRMGTDRVSYIDMAQRRSQAAKFITSWYYFSPDTKTGTATPHLKFWFTTTEDTFDEALGVLRELITGISAADEKRLADVAKRYHAVFRDKLVHQANDITRLHARRNANACARAEYTMGGVPGYRLSETMAGRFAGTKDAVIAAVRAVREAVWTSRRITASCTGSVLIAEKARRFCAAFGDGGALPKRLDAVAWQPVFEGISLPVETTYSTIFMPVQTLSPVLKLASDLLSSDVWLPEIRFKGGAYGASIRYERRMGYWDVSAYADPDFKRTWDVFRGLAGRAASLAIDRAHLEQQIIGSVNSMLNPIMPDHATQVALERFLAGETAADRCRMYDAVRSATADDVRAALSEAFTAGSAAASFCVVAGHDAVKRIAADIGVSMSIDDVFGASR